jgi:hypothetical protein
MTLKIAHIRQASLKTPAAKKSVYEIETELERVDHELAQAQQKYQRASSSSAMEEPEEQQEQENSTDSDDGYDKTYNAAVKEVGERSQKSSREVNRGFR